MATLAADLPRPWVLGEYEQHPVIANDIIYEGAAVGDNGSGYARPLTAGDPFLGFAQVQVNNTGGSAGDKGVRVKREGAVQLPVASLAITDVGKDVYASDDNTFVLTATSNSHVGVVRAFVSTGVGVVEFEAGGNRATAITDSSGGVAAASLVDVGATHDQTKLNANFATLAAKVNYLLGRGI
jgi:predicted RecA/RadA family phage recombinase